MKKIILTVVVLLVTQLSIAQDAFKNDVIKVLKASGSGAQMELAKDQIKPMISEDKFKEFSKEFDSSLPSLYDKMADVYMETYTHEEIKQMLKFYDSPVGKKITEKSSELTKKNLVAAQEWGKELQEIMMKYME